MIFSPACSPPQAPDSALCMLVEGFIPVHPYSTARPNGVEQSRATTMFPKVYVVLQLLCWMDQYHLLHFQGRISNSLVDASSLGWVDLAVNGNLSPSPIIYLSVGRKPPTPPKYREPLHDSHLGLSQFLGSICPSCCNMNILTSHLIYLCDTPTSHICNLTAGWAPGDHNIPPLLNPLLGPI